jgi:hypothetical protein
VPCRIVGGIPERAALRRTDGSISAVPCTVAEIANVVRLTGDEGAPRPELRTAVELTVTLSTPVIPPGVCWVDTPGMDDGTGLPPRWEESAAAADVLVWVTRSDAPLALSEQAVLAGHLGRHGPSGILLVANIVLADDDERRFAELVDGRLGAGLRRRVLDAAQRHGLELGEPVLLAARAMGSACHGFGGGPLRDLLTDAVALRHRAAVSRLHRARVGVGELIERVQAEVDADAQLAAELGRRDAEFAAALTAAVEARITVRATDLRAGASALAEGLADDDPLDPYRLGDRMHRAIQSALQRLGVAVERALRELCTRHGRRAPQPRDLAWLDTMLGVDDPTDLLVAVVQEQKQRRARTLGGALRRAALAPEFRRNYPIASWLLRDAVESWPEDPVHRQRMAAVLREAMRLAGESAAEQLEDAVPELVERLLASCPRGPEAASEPDPARARALQTLFEQILQPAWEALTAELAARSDPPTRRPRPVEELPCTRG